MNFDEANDYCEENGGWLTDIRNQESLDFFISKNQDPWIPIGHPVIEAWKKPDEPNNYGSGEDCAVIKCPRVTGRTGPRYEAGCFWNDVPCSHKYRPICGKEASILRIYIDIHWKLNFGVFTRGL